MIVIDKQLEQEMTARLSEIYRGEIWGKKKRFASEAVRRMLALSSDEIVIALGVGWIGTE